MRIVTVLGNTNSGAGAIYEYLIGRKDTNDPFNKKEFRLLNDPGGINDLYGCFDCYSLQSFNEKDVRLSIYKNSKIYHDLFNNDIDEISELFTDQLNCNMNTYISKYIYIYFFF